MGSLYRNGKYTYFSYRENGKNIPISLGDLGNLTNGRKKELKRKLEVRYEDNRLKNPKSKTETTDSKTTFFNGVIAVSFGVLIDIRQCH